MTNQVIPHEAVEAALKAWRETPLGGDALMNALEAAAPHIMAGAWEAGYDAGLNHDFDATSQPSNPHSGATK